MRDDNWYPECEVCKCGNLGKVICEDCYRKSISKDVLKEKITRTIKLYPHKHGEELIAEIINYLDRIEVKA